MIQGKITEFEYPVVIKVDIRLATSAVAVRFRECKTGAGCEKKLHMATGLNN